MDAGEERRLRRFEREDVAPTGYGTAFGPSNLPLTSFKPVLGEYGGVRL